MTHLTLDHHGGNARRPSALSEHAVMRLTSLQQLRSLRLLCGLPAGVQARLTAALPACDAS